MATIGPRVPPDQLLELGSEAVIVRVGSEQREFCVHTDLVRAHSAFFKAALSHKWKESKEGVVNLPEDSPVAFQIYVTWLYTQKVATKQTSSLEFNNLVESILLGEKLQDVKFKNALIDCLIVVVEDENVSLSVDHVIIQRIYQRTPSNAPVRRLLVDMCVWFASTDVLAGDEDWNDFLDKDFLIDLGKSLIGKRAGRSRPCTANRFAYHERDRLEVESDGESKEGEPAVKKARVGEVKTKARVGVVKSS